jgi:hypothetical protein
MKGGRFCFNTVHDVQANVPVKNPVAMVNAIGNLTGVSIERDNGRNVLLLLLL